MVQFRIINGYNLKVRVNGEVETYNFESLDEMKEFFQVLIGEKFEILEAIYTDTLTGKLTDIKLILTEGLNFLPLI